MITQTNPRTELAHWEALFTKHNVAFDPSDLFIAYPKQDDAYMQVVVPKIADSNTVCEIFTRVLSKYGILAAIAPVSEGTDEGAGKTRVWITHQLSDLVSVHERTTDIGSYSCFVRPHVSEESGELIRSGRFDHRMTLIEAFWYHIYMLDMHGKAYLNLQENEWQTCRGSVCTDRDNAPSLQWDLQDIKVCLRR
ncbi:MAG: hypothetical protein RLZZ234_118 [Candidatus Parcubacteria bacterium]|jgi:hypothetical protein